MRADSRTKRSTQWKGKIETVDAGYLRGRVAPSGWVGCVEEQRGGLAAER